MNSPTENATGKDMFLQIREIEKRISLLEQKFDSLKQNGVFVENNFNTDERVMQKSEQDDSLEFRIGEYLFAKAGVLVFVIGIMFLLTFPYTGISSILPPLAGYIIAAVLFLFAGLIKKSIPHISSYLMIGGIAIFFFSTLRLYYFTSQPVVSNFTLEIALLTLASLAGLVLSIRRQSVYMIALSMFFGAVTALASGSSHFIPNALVVLALLGISLSVKYHWTKLEIFVMVLSYLIYLNWLINNPFFTGLMQIRKIDAFYPGYILLYMLIFSSFYMIKPEEAIDETKLILKTILNVAFGYSLFILSLINQNSFVLFNILASAMFLGISAYFYSKIKSKYLTFIYAMSGYLALSVALISQFRIPDSLILLSLQSLLVISTAIWFRSRAIVVANFIIFLCLIFSYLALNDGMGAASLSFGIVCMLSARIMNWQKERLELKTEQMRNSYLFIALFIIPLALYHTVPERYVAFSWIGASMLYYILSKVLKTKKYRWMAIITLAATIIFAALQGLSTSDFTNRIFIFLVLGIVLVSISIAYALSKNKALLRK